MLVRMIYKHGTQYPNVQSLNINSRFKWNDIAGCHINEDLQLELDSSVFAAADA